ncbi:MAG: ABC transporter permease [Clostridia bacterium]|nr:ABC transporter permease [Clostridia bacterium]
MATSDKIKNLFVRAGKALVKFFYDNRYFFKRLGIALLNVLFAVMLTFLVLTLTPTNAIDQYAQRLVEQRAISLEEARKLAVEILGYDPNANVFKQLWNYIGNILHGNLGTSIYLKDVTANSVIKQFLPYTLFISAVALLVSFVLGISMGADMAYRKSPVKDAFMTSYIVTSSAIPDYLWGLILLYIFGCTLKWFPLNGARDITNGLPAVIDLLWHATLPVVSMVIVQTSSWAMLMRGSAVSVLGEDYVNAARARGIPNRIIVNRYLRRNAMLPLVTQVAISFAAIFGGSTLIESIFSYPGLGLQLATYIGNRDYFVVVGILFFTSVIIILANFIADSVYSFIDPRVRRDS